ncbi:aromatic ring-hydroxylating oxygenase subunit alpha [Haliea sp.]
MSTTSVLNGMDAENGVIPAGIYSDQEIFDLEMEKVFTRSWLFLAHESQFSKPGDFFRTYMGLDEVLVVLQKDGTFKAFLNQCRHRGARLCRADKGNSKAFTCPYHGWTYGTAGELMGITAEEVVVMDKLDKQTLSAIPVPRMHIYCGLIFGCWDENVAPFEESLGEFKWWADGVFNRTEAGTEVIGGVHKWVVPANWKLAAEQFTSDIYHFTITHASGVLAYVPEGAPPPELPTGRQGFSLEGHGGGFGANTDFYDAFGAMTVGKNWAKYFSEQQREEANNRLGKARGETFLSVHMNLFPNLGYLQTNQTLRVWHPRGPNEIEVWAWTLVDKDAPAEAKEEVRRSTTRTFGTSGVFEQDDSENWAEVMRSLRGPIGKRTNFYAGLGKHETRDPSGQTEGMSDSIVSESAARAFYGRWHKLMTS